MDTRTRSLHLGLLSLRVGLGMVFVAHGAQKLMTFGLAGTAGFLDQLGVPFPGANAAALIAVELFGGLALLAGAATRVSSALLAVAMTVATLLVHLPNGFFLAANGYEYTLMLGFATVALALTGPGAWSVDALVARRRSARAVDRTPVRIAA